MDIFFSDPSDIPLPPEEVRIRNLTVEPYPDGRRIKVLIEITPFLKKPSGELTIYDSAGIPAAVASFIETITPKFELTMHLRSEDPKGEYSISLTVFYADDFIEETGDEPIQRPEQTVVDQTEISFKVSAK